jgi:hypothetical protein
MNKYKLLPGGMALIKLTRNQWTLVDADKLNILLAYTWHAACGKNGRYYAATSIGTRLVYMQRFLLEHNLDHTDHVNNDSLDNRISNLRPATVAENNAAAKQNPNRGIKQRKNGRWSARTSAGTKIFDTKEEAVEWRNSQCGTLYGEFFTK